MDMELYDVSQVSVDGKDMAHQTWNGMVQYNTTFGTVFAQGSNKGVLEEQNA